MDGLIDELEFADLDIEDLALSDLRNVNGITYPCVLIGNVHLIDVLPLINSIDLESNRRFPAWMQIDGTFESIGGLSLTFDTVYLLKKLGLSLTVYMSEEDVESLNLSNWEVLERFI